MKADELERRTHQGPNAWLYREALINGYVDHTVSVRNSGTFFCTQFPNDREKQWRADLCEALITALEHPDPVIRTRAAFQATEYATRIFALGSSPGPRHCDAVREARSVVERLVRGER